MSEKLSTRVNPLAALSAVQLPGMGLFCPLSPMDPILRVVSPPMVVIRKPLTRKPLTVAHLTGEVDFSGGETQLFLLMEGLRKRGHRNVLLCPPEGRCFAEARRTDLDHLPIRMRNEWSLRNVWRIREQLKHCQPDVVHLHTGRANWLGGLAAWQLGLPGVTTRRMDRPVRRDLRTRFVYHSVVRRAVAISRAVEQRLLTGGVPQQMIRVISSSVDPESLFAQTSRNTTRAVEGLDPETPCLLAVAALIHRKGLDVLLDAMARLAEEDLFPVLWIAGSGPHRGSLEKLVRYRQLTSQVRLLGQRSDIPDLLAACDICVVPSRQEGLGVAALEAMAAGRPVVASRTGGLAEAIVDGESGLLVPPEDPAALAHAIARLLRDPSLSERVGRGGTSRVNRSFRSDRMVREYEQLYFELLDEVAGS